MDVTTYTDNITITGSTNTTPNLYENFQSSSAMDNFVMPSPIDGYICLQCRSIDFEAILQHMANLGPGESGDMVVARRTGLDRDCSICLLLSEYVLPGTYQQMPEFHISWQLRACSIRSMIVDTRTSNLFRPAPIAILHAGDGQRDYIKHLNDEKAEKKGFLVFGKTVDLRHAMENVCDQNDHNYPKSRFIAEKYDPELIKAWMAFQWSESEEDEDSGDESLDDEESDNEDSEQSHHGTAESEKTSENTPSGCGWYPDQRCHPGHAGTENTLARSPDFGQNEEEEDNRSDVVSTVSEPVEVKGMMVIDCQTLEIIDRVSEMPYITLSYVWSLAMGDLVSSESINRKRAGNATSKQLPQVIPRVVHNAIQVALDLGFQYLWVDQFCIDQQGPIEKIKENISKMDLIYSQAQVTIVAASSCGALPGVGSTQRPKPVIMNIAHPNKEHSPNDKLITIFTTPPLLTSAVMRSVWFSRGWCFQESLLSSRRLYFTDHQMLFEAEGIHCCEAYPEPHEDIDYMIGAGKYGFTENPSLAWPSSWEERLEEAQYPQELDLQDPRNRFWVEIDIYLQLVQVYTGKDFSKASDSINGFRGAMKVFSRNDKRFQVIYGHPILDVSSLKEEVTELGNFQRRAFMLLLDWIHDQLEATTKSSVRRPEFPSWSWAGWKGQIKWKSLHRVLPEDEFYVLGMDIVHLENHDGDIITLGEAPLYFEQHSGSSGYLVGKAIALTAEDFDTQTEKGEHIQRLRFRQDWKLLSWDSHVNFNLTSSPNDREFQHIRHIRDGTWGYLLMYASTSKERESKPGERLPATDEVRIMVVHWDDDTLSSSNPQGCRTCTRVGMATFRKTLALGSTESSIMETFGSLTKLTFRLC